MRFIYIGARIIASFAYWVVLHGVKILSLVQRFSCGRTTMPAFGHCKQTDCWHWCTSVFQTDASFLLDNYHLRVELLGYGGVACLVLSETVRTFYKVVDHFTLPPTMRESYSSRGQIYGNGRKFNLGRRTHTTQYTYDVVLSCAFATNLILLTDVSHSTNFNFLKKW